MRWLWCVHGPRIRLWIARPAFVIHNAVKDHSAIRNVGPARMAWRRYPAYRDSGVAFPGTGAVRAVERWLSEPAPLKTPDGTVISSLSKP